MVPLYASVIGRIRRPTSRVTGTSWVQTVNEPIQVIVDSIGALTRCVTLII
jgi:hypothetical protein